MTDIAIAPAPADTATSAINRFNAALLRAIIWHRNDSGLCPEGVSRPAAALGLAIGDTDDEEEEYDILVPVTGFAVFRVDATGQKMAQILAADEIAALDTTEEWEPILAPNFVLDTSALPTSPGSSDDPLANIAASIHPSDHEDAHVIARKAEVRLYGIGQIDRGNATWGRVNQAFGALGIELIPGISTYTFEYEVTPNIVAVYETRAHTEVDARATIEEARAVEGAVIPQNRLRYRSPANLDTAVLVKTTPLNR